MGPRLRPAAHRFQIPGAEELGDYRQDRATELLDVIATVGVLAGRLGDRGEHVDVSVRLLVDQVGGAAHHRGHRSRRHRSVAGRRRLRPGRGDGLLVRGTRGASGPGLLAGDIPGRRVLGQALAQEADLLADPPVRLSVDQSLDHEHGVRLPGQQYLVTHLVSADGGGVGDVERLPNRAQRVEQLLGLGRRLLVSSDDRQRLVGADAARFPVGELTLDVHAHGFDLVGTDLLDDHRPPPVAGGTMLMVHIARSPISSHVVTSDRTSGERRRVQSKSWTAVARALRWSGLAELIGGSVELITRARFICRVRGLPGQRLGGPSVLSWSPVR